MKHIGISDAERLEELKLNADTAGDDYERLLEQSQELTLRISRVRIDYLRKVRAYNELRDALAGMAKQA